MNQKFYLNLLLIALLSNHLVKGQNTLPINNITAKFTVLRTSLQLLDSTRISPPRYMIDVKLSESEKKQLKALSKSFWIDCLQNTKTDWAANLLLYDLYEKDAIFYWNKIKTRSDWILIGKIEDLAYWSNKLK